MVLALCKLANNKIEGKGVGALIYGLKKSSARKLSLSFGWNKINTEGAILLADLFTAKHVERLGVEHCSVGIEGLVELAKAIQESPNKVQALNISGNKLGNEALKCIAPCIHKVARLYAEANKIDEDGIKHLAGLEGLVAMNLYGNSVGKEGARELTIRAKTGLRKIILEKCSIGDEGAMHISHAISICKSLQLLNLSNFRV